MIVDSWQLAVSSWQLTAGSQQLAVSSWQSTVGSQQLAVSSWPLAADGRWQLAVGDWGFAIQLRPGSANPSDRRRLVSSYFDVPAPSTIWAGAGGYEPDLIKSEMPHEELGRGGR